MKLFFILFILFSFYFGAAAQKISGFVYERNESGSSTPIIGARVFWPHSLQGVYTDSVGRFLLENLKKEPELVISALGYYADTIQLGTKMSLQVFLRPQITDSVVITEHRGGSFLSIDPINKEVITKKEIVKAACCNLSEAFENNASADVSYTDAVSGAKQIQMLGLAGTYTQILTENIPSIRGLGRIFGLNYIPGSWIQSINVTKGIGSVINGYESIAGQINTGLLDPKTADKLELNLYMNHYGRSEANVALRHKVTSRSNGLLMLHGSTFPTRIDRNGDGFLDSPLSTQLSGLWRFNYESGSGYESKWGVQGIYEDKLGGQIRYSPEQDRGTTQQYGFGSWTNRYEVFGKNGFVFENSPYHASIGSIVHYSRHRQSAYFGLNQYLAAEDNLNINLIGQLNSPSEQHSLSGGVSLLYDDVTEDWRAPVPVLFKRKEFVPGIFAEYVWKPVEQFTGIVGVRYDQHSLFGSLFTPRVNVRWRPFTKTNIRMSFGRGYRAVYPFAENFGFLVSNRNFIFPNKQLLPDIAWNTGITASHEFFIFKRPASVTADVYHTWFSQQVVFDSDARTNEIDIYQLSGKSYATTTQVEFQYSFFKNWEFKVAGKWYETKQQNSRGLLFRVMVPQYRSLVNLAYDSPKWRWSFTWHYFGQQRLPEMSINNNAGQNLSPAYSTFMTQVTRVWRKWEFYVGGENLLDFRQLNPIYGWEQPFAPGFDAGMAWGPVLGRVIYAGLRWKLQQPSEDHHPGEH